MVGPCRLSSFELLAHAFHLRVRLRREAHAATSHGVDLLSLGCVDVYPERGELGEARAHFFTQSQRVWSTLGRRSSALSECELS